MNREGFGRTIALALFAMSADAALAFSYGRPIVFSLILLPAAAPVVRLTRVPSRAAVALSWVTWALVVAVAARGDTIGLAAGAALAVLAAIFLANERAFPVHRTFLPAAIGVFLAAASNGTAPHFAAIAWIATAVLAFWLVAAMPGGPKRAAPRLVVFAIFAVAIGQGLIVLLPWLQPRVEESVAGMMDPTVAATGLSIGGRLGDVERLALSRRVVLRMWSAQPADLRAGVYTQFDGRVWRVSPTAAGSRLLAPTNSVTAPASMNRVGGPWRAAAGAPVPTTPAFARFLVEEQSVGFLAAPSTVDAVQSSEGPIALDRFDLVHAPPEPPHAYAVRYTPGAVPMRQGDEELARECLQVPSTIDPRVRALARQLGPETAAAKEKIARTIARLQTTCRYSLDVGAFKTADPLSEFLFDKKKGYCEYFASATVMLLRLQGVPARYVNGLSVRGEDRRGDHFVVRASDAHAWAEALVPDTGWMEVDSTPPGDYAAVHDARHSWVEDALETAKSWWDAASIPNLVVAFALGLASVVAAIMAARRLRRIRRRAPRAAPLSLGVPAELVACLRQLETLWARAGYPRPLHRGPLEHAAALPADRVGADLRSVSVEVVQRFYEGAYGGAPIARAEISRLAQALDRCRRLL
ncbi:MAG TPA: transglutaminaseTgpA domain-containing protein [Vicinamibacterales bacterium]|nr:transglutaminaseTgpA domain-containing protein [Vicinamibacterales bacterium]